MNVPNGLTVTDLFCGAGGSSTGLVQAGFRVIIAANHWARAIESHQLNHPATDHSNADISQVNPAYFPRTDLLWASPECTNHSIAKGVRRQRAEDAALFELDGVRPLPDEAANRSRATMWDVPRFAEYHRYKAIIIENVVDAHRWVQFPAWLLAMELLGYQHEIVWLNSMHAQGAGLPAPQSRDRMYVVFWRKDLASAKHPRPRLEQWTRPRAVCPNDGEVRAVQAFKKAEQWGRYRAQYVYRCPKCAAVIEPAWLPAASAIDWSLRGERIGGRKKPLAEKTRVRIQKGIERYWRPIVVTAAGNTYDSASGKPGTYLRARPVDEVLPTQHASGGEGVAVPPSLLVPVEGRDGKSAASVLDPMRTQSTRAETAIVVPLRNHGVAKLAMSPLDTVSANGNHHALIMTNNHTNRSRPVDEALPTVTTATTHALVMRNNEGGAEMSTPVVEPLRALTTAGHQSLLSAEPISLDVDDVEFRMLEPDEIKRGMAFPSEYILLGSKREQVKQSGNAVTPPAARDLGHAVAEFLKAVTSS